MSDFPESQEFACVREEGDPWPGTGTYIQCIHY